jgi:hypothetical protein
LSSCSSVMSGKIALISSRFMSAPYNYAFLRGRIPVPLHFYAMPRAKIKKCQKVCTS